MRWNYTPVRAESVEVLARMLRALLGLSAAVPDARLALRLTSELVTALVAGAALSFPIGKALERAGSRLGAPAAGALRAGIAMVALGLLVLSSARLASGTYNPFIYFKF